MDTTSEGLVFLFIRFLETIIDLSAYKRQRAWAISQLVPLHLSPRVCLRLFQFAPLGSSNAIT